MKRIQWIIFIILLAIIFAQYILKQPPKEIVKIVHKVDTITTIIPKYIPKPYYKDTGSTKYIHDTVPVPIIIDTAAILADYIRTRLYRDTLMNDSTGFFLINDKVQYNRIISRKPVIRIYAHTTTITNPPHAIILAGVGAGYNVNRFGLSGNLMYIDRRRHGFGLSYDPINKFAEVSIFWPIKK